jgi:hypothetical protein
MLDELLTYLWGGAILGLLMGVTIFLHDILKELKKKKDEI